MKVHKKIHGDNPMAESASKCILTSATFDCNVSTECSGLRTIPDEFLQDAAISDKSAEQVCAELTEAQSQLLRCDKISE